MRGLNQVNMTIDAAYIPIKILQKLRTNCGNNNRIQGRVSSGDAVVALFRLGEGVATVLQFFPSKRSPESTLNSDEDVSTDSNNMEIHPLLLRVLVRSNDIIKSVSIPLLEGSDNGIEKIEVTPSSYDSSSSTFSDELDNNGEKGYLEKVLIREYFNSSCQANTTDSLQVKIHLGYMCSQNDKWKFYFHEISNNSRMLRGAINLLAQKLEYRVIAQGSILCLDMKESSIREYDSSQYFPTKSEGYQPEVVFFVVDKIEFNKIQSLTSYFEGNNFHECIRLGSAESISISLGLPATNSVTDQVNEQELTPHQNEKLSDLRVIGNQQNIVCKHSCHGYDSVLQELIDLATFNDSNSAPTAVVLSGCSGVGKSRMSLWVGEELNKAAATSIVLCTISVKDILLEITSSTHFDSSRVLKNIRASSKSVRCLLIIDDLDVIADSNSQDDFNASATIGLESGQQRALQAVVNLLDSVIVEFSSRCFILGISRGSWAQLPQQLGRIGRFEKVVNMSSPSLVQRRAIFKFWISTLPLDVVDDDKKDKIISQWVDLLAPRTAGCVASDIRRICAEALTKAVARSSKMASASNESGHFVDFVQKNIRNVRLAQSATVTVSWDDVRDSARACVPSQLSSLDVIPASLGDSFSHNNIELDPKKEFKLAWKNFGGYDLEKQRLYRTVVRPWKHHIERVHSVSQNKNCTIKSKIDIPKPSGVIFFGPSGCGKSVAALYLASSLGLHCVKVRASEVFSQWLGGSEATLRSIFARARAASPCILFFDELDSLAMKRETDDADASSGVQSRILTTLLNEMDGISNAGGQQGILVVAATNRLESIDVALLRPGRLEEHVKLSLPDASSIEDIFKIHTAKIPVENSIDFKALGVVMEESKLSCAEIEGLCRDACLVAMRRFSEQGKMGEVSLKITDFDETYRQLKGQSFLARNST